MMKTTRLGRHVFGCFVLLAAAAVSTTLYAQTADTATLPASTASAAPTPDPGQGLVVVELFNKSVVINSIIFGLSVIALLLFTYFFLMLRGPMLAPPLFVDEISKLVRTRQFKEAADYCRGHQRFFIASIVQRCVENTDKPHGVLMGILDSEGRRRADIIWNRINYLADVSNVAPMLGLLGTVLGMIEAFFGLEYASASINAKVLSNAIGGAMATTMFGLIVGIMALVFHAIVKGRLIGALAEAEQAAHSLADQINRSEP